MVLVNMAMLCIEGHWLPRAGGLLDQDSWFIEVLQTIVSAQAARKNREMQSTQRNMPKPKGR
jgi:hypothetical protein